MIASTINPAIRVRLTLERTEPYRQDSVQILARGHALMATLVDDDCPVRLIAHDVGAIEAHHDVIAILADVGVALAPFAQRLALFGAATDGLD